MRKAERHKGKKAKREGKPHSLTARRARGAPAGAERGAGGPASDGTGGFLGGEAPRI